MNGRRVILRAVLGLGLLMGLVPSPAIAGSAGFPFSLGAVPSQPGKYPVAAAPGGMGMRSLPRVVDLSGDLPPVANQGTQSSCVAWAVGYYYKSFQEKQERRWELSSPDHQFSPAFIYNQRATSNCSEDRGMSIPAAMHILLDDGELPLLAFPYDPADSCTQPTAEQLSLSEQYRAASYDAIFIGQGWADLDALKQHLVTGDPLVIAVPVYPSFLSSCADPIVDVPDEGETWYGAHAVLVVGYDDEVGGFRFVNSWGTGYGCEGFAYLSYEFTQDYAYEAWKMTDEVTWVNEPPSVGSADPGNGGCNPGQPVVFTTSYSDPNGWEDISRALFEVGDGESAHSVLLRYSADDNRIWLRDEGDSQWLGGYEPGTQTIIENGRVTVDLSASSVSGEDDGLQVRWSVQFTEGYLGSHTSYLKVKDAAGVSTGWTEVGQWSVFRNAMAKRVRGETKGGIGSFLSGAGGSPGGATEELTATRKQSGSGRSAIGGSLASEGTVPRKQLAGRATNGTPSR